MKIEDQLLLTRSCIVTDVDTTSNAKQVTADVLIFKQLFALLVCKHSCLLNQLLRGLCRHNVNYNLNRAYNVTRPCSIRFNSDSSRSVHNSILVHYLHNFYNVTLLNILIYMISIYENEGQQCYLVLSVTNINSPVYLRGCIFYQICMSIKEVLFSFFSKNSGK